MLFDQCAFVDGADEAIRLSWLGCESELEGESDCKTEMLKLAG